VAVTPDGSKAVVCDRGNNKIRLVDMATGRVSTLAGSGSYGFQDGAASSARFNNPSGVVVTLDGRTAVVSDRGNDKIRLVDMATGRVGTLAGSGTYGFQDGAASSARFSNPTGLAVTSDGSKAVVTDYFNNKIRVVDIATGTVITLAGSGSYGSQDGAAGSATFNNPTGVAVTPDGSKAVVADRGNVKIRLVDMVTGAVITLAGSGGYGSQDGTAGSARFSYLSGVAVTPYGSKAVVADTSNHKICLVDMATGAVIALAGSGSYGFQDGLASSARFYCPTGVALTSNGSKAVVIDENNHKIRLVDLMMPTCVVCEVLSFNQCCPCHSGGCEDALDSAKCHIVETLNVWET